jgi:hypothetical protein
MAEPGPTTPPPEAAGPPETPSRPARRRRRVVRWLLAILLLGGTALTLAAVWFLQDARLTRLVREQLSLALDTPVELNLRRRGLHSFEVLDLRIGGDSLAPPFLEIARLGVFPRPGRLLDKRICLDSLVVEGLHLRVAWRDSLFLPAWLAASDSSAPEDSSADDPFRHLATLADHGWQLDSTRVVVRDLRLGLHGSQSGQPLALDSPPFHLDLALPRLGPAALRHLSRRNLPPELLARLLVAWSGSWQDGARGSALRPLPLPPGTLATLREAGLDLERHPDILQELSLELGLARDTLRLESGLVLRPRDLDLRWEKRALPLPQRLEARLMFSLPVRATPLRADLDLRLDLQGPGLDSRSRLDAGITRLESRWRARASFSQTLVADLDRLDELGRAVQAPPLAGDLRLEMRADVDLSLDSSFSDGSGRYREELVLTSRRLGLPGYGVEARDLRLRQSLSAGLELADPLPRQPKLELEGTLAAVTLGLAPLDEPEQLDLRLSLLGGGPGDSLTLAADLSVGSWQQGRVDLSVNGRLPGLAEWMRDYEAWLAAPQRFQDLPLQLDMETSRLDLGGLDPSLAGAVRASARLNCGRGVDLWLEAVPGDLLLEAAGQRLDLPLHRLEVEGHLRLGPLDAALPWPDTLWLEARPDPLPPLALQLGRVGREARLRAQWDGFDLPGLLALLPAVWQPEGVALDAGRAFLDADLRLGEDGLPRFGSTGLTVAGLRAASSGYGVDGLDLRLDLALDSLGVDFVLDGTGESIRQDEPAWSWDGLSLAGSGRVMAPLQAVLEDSLFMEPGRGGAWPAEATLELGLRSLQLGSRLRAELADWRSQRPDLATLDLRMGGEGLVRPWPGLSFAGTLELEQELRALGDGFYRTDGSCRARLDSLAWKKEATLERLELDLPLAQVVRVDPTFSLAADRRRGPVDWNALRGWDRRLPDFQPRTGRRPGREGEGWALRVAKARYEAWSLESLLMDLRVGQGRLDIPEFRFDLFGGGVLGSAEVVGLDSTSYGLDCSLIGLDSRYFEFGDRTSGQGQRGLVHAVLDLEGQGLDLGALDHLRGSLRMPDLDRQVTLNLLRALDAQGVDPSIGRIRRLLELPGFRYRVERVEFDVAHGFARPRVSLRKSPFSPLPDVAIPMSPLPLGFMVRNFALAGEETP